MDVWSILIVAGLLLPVASGVGYMTWRGRRRTARLRHLVDQARVCGTQVVQGERVAVWGRCQGEASLRAPFSGEPVCGYRVRVVGVNHMFNTWGSEVLLLDRTQVADFELQDDAGRIWVRGEHGVLLGDERLYADNGLLLKRDAPERVTSYLAAFGCSTSVGVGMGSRLCWYEYRLTPGDAVLVVGQGARLGGQSSLEAPVGGKLIIADRDHAALLRSMGDLDLPADLVEQALKPR